MDEVSGEVIGVEVLEAGRSESSPELEDLEEALPGKISGAL